MFLQNIPTLTHTVTFLLCNFTMSEHVLTYSLFSFPQEAKIKVKYLSLKGRIKEKNQSLPLPPLLHTHSLRSTWYHNMKSPRPTRSRVTCSSSHLWHHDMKGSHLSPFAITGRHNCLFLLLRVCWWCSSLFRHTGCVSLSVHQDKREAARAHSTLISQVQCLPMFSHKEDF